MLVAFPAICRVSSYRHPFSNVPSVKPIILVQGFRRSLRILQVPSEHIFSLDANLTEKKNIRYDVN